MMYKPESKVLAKGGLNMYTVEVEVEMMYKPESKVLVLVNSKMIKEWCERQVPRKVLGDSHLKNSDNWLKKLAGMLIYTYK